MDYQYRIELMPLSEADGGGYAAVVPALPGCMGTGDTWEEAVQDVRSAIKEWIFSAKELGREVPGPEVYQENLILV
ncbi:type II toxin-antitoxin system HicB family antitoxin [Peptococcus simiae]|uniref:type II toxin-antitoxin system HicB family antitoxin n=1 Tax=Peptococcus simiae TaxID=1643805 RepID=UPI003981298A